MGAGTALAALSAAVFVAGLDQTVVVSVLPQIVTDLRLPINRFDEAAWLVTAYLLGFSAALPLLGRLADVYGYRALFGVCAALFAGGSLWAAASGGLWGIVAARALQGAGGGGMIPIALAGTAALYDGRARIVALGAATGAAEAGAVLGPLYGAGMLEAFGWRSVFWVNLPLTVALLAAVATFVRARSVAAGSVDFLGAVLLGLSLSSLTLGISGSSLGVGGDVRAPLLAAAVLLAAGFLVRQARARWPLLSLSLFRDTVFASANAVSFFVGAALIVALVEVPLFATVILDRDTTGGGLMLLRLTAFIPVGALTGGWLSARVSRSLVVALGMTASAAGFARLSLWDTGLTEPVLTLDLGLTGLGFGLVLAPLAASVLDATKGGAEAIGAAILTVARTIGMLVGLATLTTWGLTEFNERVAAYRLPLPKEGQDPAVYDRLLALYEAHVEDSALFVFDRLFLVACVLCALAAVPALFLRHAGGTEGQARGRKRYSRS